MDPDEFREYMTIAYFVGDTNAFWSGLGYCAFYCQLDDGELYLESKYGSFIGDEGSTFLSQYFEGIHGNETEWVGK